LGGFRPSDWLGEEDSGLQGKFVFNVLLFMTGTGTGNGIRIVIITGMVQMLIFVFVVDADELWAA
jgi:hypothetical protein